jgi:hypothetical protein
MSPCLRSATLVTTYKHARCHNPERNLKSQNRYPVLGRELGKANTMVGSHVGR